MHLVKLVTGLQTCLFSTTILSITYLINAGNAACDKVVCVHLRKKKKKGKGKMIPLQAWCGPEGE